jgi:hypothetical protein
LGNIKNNKKIREKTTGRGYCASALKMLPQVIHSFITGVNIFNLN